jgi:hypothetical protein
MMLTANVPEFELKEGGEVERTQRKAAMYGTPSSPRRSRLCHCRTPPVMEETIRKDAHRRVAVGGHGGRRCRGAPAAARTESPPERHERSGIMKGWNGWMRAR